MAVEAVLVQRPAAARKSVKALARSWDGENWHPHEEAVVEEVPVSVLINGASYALMLATPTDLEDFAVGFLWTEAVLLAPEELLALEMEETENGVAIYLQVSAAAAERAARQRRAIPGGSACGLCGRPDFSGLQPFAPLRSAGRPEIRIEILQQTFAAMQGQQRQHQENGSTHAAAVRQRNGVCWVREDIGRHNAVDKVIGAALRQGLRPGSAELLAVSSRLPFEIVRKALSWRIPSVAAISGVSSLALRMAQENHLQIIGFTRAGRCTFYGQHASHGVSISAID